MKGNKFVILIIGASGMLGNTLFRYLSQFDKFKVYGTLRKKEQLHYFDNELRKNIILDIDIRNLENLEKNIFNLKPNLIINCVGIIKQKILMNNNLDSIQINSLFPHQLAKISTKYNSRLLHFSTDCVFSGKKGMYKEEDFADASDIYGRTKLLGEVLYPNTITLRTSIIGHEINSSVSLINWFLSQNLQIKGFKRAIFSGLPTVEVARIIKNFIIPLPKLNGLFHLSGNPISKYELLKIVSNVYQKKIEIKEDNKFIIDKSLCNSKFRKETNFMPKSWDQLIQEMKDFK